MAGPNLTLKALAALRNCPSHTYLVVQQDGLSNELSTEPDVLRAVPALLDRSAGANPDLASTLVVPEVVGSGVAADIASGLASRCGAVRHVLDESGTSSALISCVC